MQNNDFIQIAYIGKIKESGEVFDKTDDIVVIVGAGYVIKGLDEAFLGMNIGDKKTIEVEPEKAFGKRDLKLLKLVPESEFRKHNTKPVPGMFIDTDKMRGRVLSVSSGRVKVDFNHPLAGKVLAYDLEIKGKIEDIDEKISGIVCFYTNLQKDKIKVSIKEKEVELIIPPVVHPAFKKKISDDIIKFLEIEKVKFSEVFEKKEEK